MKTAVVHSDPPKRKSTRFEAPSLLQRMWKHRILLLLLVPALVWYGVFCYAPMYGNLIAFKAFSFKKGIWGSPWVGFSHFTKAFENADFWHVFFNQVIISVNMLILNFPLPITIALLLNEVGKTRRKRFFQTVYTFPHFISWIVVASVFFNLLSSEGIVNQVLTLFGVGSQSLLMNPDTFRLFLYLTMAWKESGWSAILYLAALTAIDPELYNAAAIDGAGRWKQLLHITWPGIQSTAAILLVLSAGNILSGGFDQIINLYNPAVRSVSDIVDTYIYRAAILQGEDFGYTAAIGLFKSVINLLMLVLANASVKLLGEEGIF